MKIKDGYIARQVAGQTIVVAVGEAMTQFNGMISLNETAAFLWNRLASGATRESLAAALVDAYAVDGQTALQDVESFLAVITQADLVDA
jgi:hypothetical protein